MKQRVILGFDTSNYRTSTCLIDLNGTILAEKKELLQVPRGERGLMQSEAVFQHVKQLPEQMEHIFDQDCEVVAISVSTAPRPVEGSYMPVFKVGEMLARSLAAAFGVPLYLTTHQEGHIAAAEYSNPERPESSRFLAVHLSGGTSEILHCERTSTGYSIEKIGGTRDLHAGQLIDRVGVALGLAFPAGPGLEALALKSSPHTAFHVPSSVKGLDFHLSGPETALLKAIRENTAPPEEIARATEKVIANSLEKALRNAVEQGFPAQVLIVGGVASNRYLKSRLKKRLEHPAVGCRLFFTEPAYSGDNAYGVARIGLLHWQQQQNKPEH
ncbi:MAG: O-sialoglycoprotein endopeptidase [Bacillaceae bacterium]|nr:O-sialoglycoprotein endopeptidase [Bacillaceae bacterium]